MAVQVRQVRGPKLHHLHTTVSHASRLQATAYALTEKEATTLYAFPNGYSAN